MRLEPGQSGHKREWLAVDQVTFYREDQRLDRAAMSASVALTTMEPVIIANTKGFASWRPLSPAPS